MMIPKTIIEDTPEEKARIKRAFLTKTLAFYKEDNDEPNVRILTQQLEEFELTQKGIK